MADATIGAHLPPPPERQRRVSCARCQRPLLVCLCSALPDPPGLASRTAVTILRHPKEAKRKVVTTAPLVELCLHNCRIVTGTELQLGGDACVVAANEGRRWLLLYPGDGAVPADELDNSVPSTLFVLDGTWKQARNATQPLSRCHSETLFLWRGFCDLFVLRVLIACPVCVVYPTHRRGSCTKLTQACSAAASKSHCQPAPHLASLGLSGCNPGTIFCPQSRALLRRCGSWNLPQHQTTAVAAALVAAALVARRCRRRFCACLNA